MRTENLFALIDIKDLSNFAAKSLLAARIKCKISQRELAKRAGLSLTTIFKTEVGTGSPSLTNFLQILKSLGPDGVREFLKKFEGYVKIKGEFLNRQKSPEDIGNQLSQLSDLIKKLGITKEVFLNFFETKDTESQLDTFLDPK